MVFILFEVFNDDFDGLFIGFLKHLQSVRHICQTFVSNKVMENLRINLLVLEFLWYFVILGQIELFAIVMAKDYLNKMWGSCLVRFDNVV